MQRLCRCVMKCSLCNEFSHNLIYNQKFALKKKPLSQINLRKIINEKDKRKKGSRKYILYNKMTCSLTRLWFVFIRAIISESGSLRNKDCIISNACSWFCTTMQIETKLPKGILYTPCAFALSWKRNAPDQMI